MPVLLDASRIDEDAVDALPKPHSYVGRRDEYLPGSRSDVIQVITHWLEDPNQLTFWMRGGAGLGKSTLAHELVDSLQADGRLATFAFLLRGSSTDPGTLIQTMARELGASHPRAIPQIAAAARACKSSHRPLREYMESYIINPICSLSYPYPLVIIVDGLDEWEHHEMFLKELKHIPPSSPLKILLISRPNYSIERSLLKVAVQKYELPPVSQAITEQYFNHHFAKMDWEMRKPSQFTISDLARLADGLLIWAAMVCSLLSHEMRTSAPHELLDRILSSGKEIALEGQLSNLYRDALKQLFPEDRDQKLFRQVFGAMAILRESLPLRDFARLLGISHYQVKAVQSKLTALQTRATFDEHTVPTASQCFHSSFVEFTMSEESEAGNPLIPYLINPRMAHESVAEGCLAFLDDFFLSFRGRECSSSDLRGLELYTVKFWPLHVADCNDRFSPLPPTIENRLLQLAEYHLRRWGSWFLAINLPTSSEDWDQVVGGMDKHGFYYSLADLLEKNMTMDTTLALHRTSCLEIAVRLEPKDEKAWNGLGHSYRQRFDSTNNLDLLNTSIIVYRHALELPSNDGSHLDSMFDLGSALWSRFQRTGLISDIEETISMFRELLSFYPTSYLNRPSLLTGLGVALDHRFRRTGSITDVEEAISMHRESLSLCPSPHPLRFLSLNNLAASLCHCFHMTGSMTDVDEAISLYRESLSLRPSPHPLRSASLNNLAVALSDRYNKTAVITDLEEAFSMYHESLSLRPSPHPERSTSLYNLASSLHSRFLRTGSVTDLEEAILMHRESLSLRPSPHPDRPSSLIALANALCDRFEKISAITDLEEGISMYRESLCLCPAPLPNHLLALRNLASALEVRFEENGVQSDLDEASSLSREVLAIQSQ
jgi:tetratricopeptide (TPR) repeat protein